MQEVSLKEWLPEGWSGTADWLLWHPEYEAFTLGDLKTTKGESLRFIREQGIKDTHHWQLSAYWYALEKMGIPLLKGFAVMYLPMNVVPRDQTEPIILEGEPIDRDLVLGTMESRWADTKTYLDDVRRSVTAVDGGGGHWFDRYEYIQDSLAPVQERVQKLYWDKAGHWNVVLVPHWSTNYCPYPVELCDCSTQGTEKIGHWRHDGDELAWVPRRGYDIVPIVKPDQKEVNKRVG
jgi:hypothetical protein